MSTQEQSRKRARSDQSSKPANGPVQALTEREKILELIRSKGNEGIRSCHIKKEIIMPQSIINKQVKMLLQSNLVKEVKDVRLKSKKVLMAAEFEPSEEITGGTWFSDGSLNKQVINNVKRRCKQQIIMFKAATADMIWKGVKKSEPHLEYTMQQIGEILDLLVLEEEVEKVTSTGKGDFASVPAGRVCYKTVQIRSRAHSGGLASITCVACPRLKDCTPDGVISPKNCEYYAKWLHVQDIEDISFPDE